jgi:NAD(P)-dependent dehydrogenase (short-subunit alcohol dehydrogenase family)
MARARAVDATGLAPEDILLTGKAVVVTAGGAGIGLGVALAAARFGADVGVLDLDPDRCAAAKQAITACRHRVIAVACDVLETEALRVAIEQVATEFGRLDVLVNNAGGVRGGSFLTQPERSMRKQIDLNLTSMLVAS